jgi:hypothetical protein
MAIKFWFRLREFFCEVRENMVFSKPLAMGFAIGMMMFISSLAQSFNPARAEDTKTPTSNYAAPIDNSKPQTVLEELILEARLTSKGQPVEKGVVWRIFSDKPDADGKLAVIGNASGGTSSFLLAAGTYLVHAAFGRAGATKKVILGRGGNRETFVLEAGGLKLNAIAGNSRIKSKSLLFSVFSSEKDENNKRKVIVRDVPADRIVRLNAGTYHVISEYGKINATVRADLRVRAGKLTEATLQHRAARITLKLVSETGGEAIANTAWSIISGQGAVVKESSSTFPSMVLASGSYTAVARNAGIVYTRDFTVEDGKNGYVEVLAAR